MKILFFIEIYEWALDLSQKVVEIFIEIFWLKQNRKMKETQRSWKEVKGHESKRKENQTKGKKLIKESEMTWKKKRIV